MYESNGDKMRTKTEHIPKAQDEKHYLTIFEEFNNKPLRWLKC